MKFIVGKFGSRGNWDDIGGDTIGQARPAMQSERETETGRDFPIYPHYVSLPVGSVGLPLLPADRSI